MEAFFFFNKVAIEKGVKLLSSAYEKNERQVVTNVIFYNNFINIYFAIVFVPLYIQFFFFL